MSNEYAAIDNDEDQTSKKKEKIKGDDLTYRNIYAYGVGHVPNDISISLWFNFTVYFLTDIVILLVFQIRVLVWSCYTAS